MNDPAAVRSRDARDSRDAPRVGETEPAARATVGPAPHAVITPYPTSDDDLVLAAVRVWAAEVRDRRPPHRDASADAVLNARLLCGALDRLDGARPGSPLYRGFEMTCRQLVGKLLGLGVRPPVLPRKWDKP